jgi:hypothetical protein
MILKKLKRRVFRKPKATMIRELITYVLQPKDENGKDKLSYHGAKNFISETQKGQQAEMIHLAAESVRSPMPVTHWCLSWKENEQPSHEQIDEAVDMFLQRMGLEGHQVIYAQHKNTAHAHVHIVVNRTHPDTLKVIQPHKGFDIEAAHRIVAELVHKQGWAAENKARYRVNENGEIARNIVGLFTSSVKTSSAAADFESATGEKSAERIAQEKGDRAIRKADSWAELHQNMQKAGLRFEKKGSGAVVFVGEVAVKASSIDRHFGLSKLCKRLGEYEPGDYAPEMKPPEPEPVSTIVKDEWREYRALKKQKAEERREDRKRRQDFIAQAKVKQRAQRHTTLSSLARYGVSMLNIGRHFLKKQQQAALHRLREELPKREKALPRFATWLEGHNLRARLLMRYRRRKELGADVQTFEFPKIGDMVSPYTAYRELLLQKSPEKIDDSRLDAMIALRMRLAGYTMKEVGREIIRQAQTLRGKIEHRDWKDYAGKTTIYAFGAAGHIDIMNFKPTPEKILSFHQEAERLEAARMGTVEIEREAPRMRMR